MSLRRKLLTMIGALGFLGLVLAGVTVWAVGQWEESSTDLRDHYTRSLQVQEVRATTFEALKEVSDAISEKDEEAEQEFEEAMKPAARDLDTWADLAHTADEKEQVREVRAAHATLLEDADRIFAEVEKGNLLEAADISEGKLEGEHLPAFDGVTEKAVTSDQNYRDVVQERNQDIRGTAQLVLFGVAFGMMSLLLLVAAYLASDLFRPLREIENALQDLERGDLDRRLPEERADELGALARAFNRAAESVSRRLRIESLATASLDERDDPSWRGAPSRVTLHRLVSQLRSRVSHLSDEEASGKNGSGEDNGRAAERRALVGELDRLSQAVARVTEFGFPLDLDLARTDMRALLYRVFMRFQDEFAERAVALELDIAPEVDHAIVDRLKLREALTELLRNALNALPERGGRLGLRAHVSEDGTELVIEIADEGVGSEAPLLGEVLDAADSYPDDRPRVGLTMTKAIVEQHGGEIEIESEPGQGTYVQTRLPLRK